MKKQRKKANRRSFHSRNTMIMTFLVLVPVVIVATVNFFVLYYANVGAVQSDLRLRSQQTIDILNTNIGSMEKLVSQRRMDTTFSNAAQSKIGTVYFPIIQQLREDSIWTTFFSSVRFYNRDSGLVYELNRALTEEDCFGTPQKMNSAYYRTDALELKPWDRAALEETGSQIRVMRVRHADGEDSGVMLAVPLEYLSNETPVSYMLFIVSDETLQTQIGALEGTTCVLYFQDTPIYSTDPAICELIYEGRDLRDTFSGSDILSFGEGETIHLEWKISSGFQMKRVLPTILLQSAVTFGGDGGEPGVADVCLAQELSANPEPAQPPAAAPGDGGPHRRIQIHRLHARRLCLFQTLFRGIGAGAAAGKIPLLYSR